MEHIIKGSLENRLKRIERKIILLTYLIFGAFLSLKTERKWAIRMFLCSDLLLMADTLMDLVKEFHYKVTHRKKSRR